MNVRRIFVEVLHTSVGRIGLILVAFFVFIGGVYYTMFSMPGSSFEGPAPPLNAQQTELRERLHRHVHTLSGEIGVRNMSHPEQLQRARVYILKQWKDMGFTPSERTFSVDERSVANLEVEIRGKKDPGEIIVIGAHYDTVMSPGADDNASGVAGLLELSREFSDQTPDRTVRFVAFVNEEPPFYRDEEKMGSRVYARRARERNESIRAMISLEMLGYYSSEDGSQDYPFPLSLIYPSTGDFIGFVSNFSSRHLLRRTLREFRQEATIPSEGGAPPGWVPGVGWSDHWSFWQEGYAAMMVTDTAVFRNPHYHRSTDRPDTLDYTAMSRVVDGLKPVVTLLGSGRR